MKAELLIQFALGAIAEEERLEPLDQVGQGGHARAAEDELKNAVDRAGGALPERGLGGELPRAGAGQDVVAGAAVVVGDAPLGRTQPFRSMR